MSLTKEEHIRIHKELHNSLDKLVADWLHQTGGLPSKNSVMSLMKWSYQQTLDPKARENYVLNKKEVEPGDIIQVNPDSQLGDKNGFFAGCLLFVEEVKGFGVMAFAPVPENRGEMPKRAYIRLNWEDFEFVGHAEWKPQN